jgi:hypothetical protein
LWSMTDPIDDALDRCRHGKTAAESCAICDARSVDLRDGDEVDLTSEPASEELSGQ